MKIIIAEKKETKTDPFAPLRAHKTGICPIFSFSVHVQPYLIIRYDNYIIFIYV